jgi:GT2 family glycosyltransferase
MVRAIERLGVVVIGRNEGPRLVRSLDSVRERASLVVYVDSGSTDRSVDNARARGVEVVNLDMNVPFTAARARNAGFERLLQLRPDVEHVFFVDGDCEVLDGFLEAAIAEMDVRPDVVAVCGYRRERFPEKSLYNRVCDVEWRSGPVGECRAFGGDVLIRVDALRAVGGYDPDVIAAEDDELGIRLRRAGGKLWRIDRESTLHDAAMTKAEQWWKRAMRCGHAYAQVSTMHGADAERYFVAEKRRSLTWGAAIPAVAVGLAPLTLGASIVGLAGLYPLQAVRIARDAHRRGLSLEDAIAWGISCAASKVPEAVGIAKFHADRLAQKRPEIIEYKGPSSNDE